MPGSDTAAAADKAELDSATLEDQQGLQPGVSAVEQQLQQMELQDAQGAGKTSQPDADCHGCRAVLPCCICAKLFCTDAQCRGTSLS